MKIYDAIVIGGGPAGLSAAIYLARSNRSVLVIDKGDGRSKGKQLNENYLGFPKGIKAKKLSELGKEQAERFGAEFCGDIVLKASCEKKGKKRLYKLRGKNKEYQGRGLIIATGVRDIFPSFPGAEKYIGTSIFWCMMCDAWKVKNKKVLVVGVDDHSVQTALRLLNYTKEVSFLVHCAEGESEISQKSFNAMKKHGIHVYSGSIAKVSGKDGHVRSVITAEGQTIKTQYIFSKLGYTIQNEIAEELGAAIESKGFIKCDADMRTSMPFLYAAGDVTNDTSHQIVSAAHQGAVAGTSLDEDLMEDFQK